MKKSRLVVFVFCIIVAFVTRSLGQSTGNVSFYASSMHGRRTSDGGTYHKDSMTCAHRYLPFGTLLKVTNPANGKSVVVRVTDRGPYSKKLCLDLSYAAAEKLDIIRQGFARVEYEVLSPLVVPYRPKEKTEFFNENVQAPAASISRILHIEGKDSIGSSQAGDK